MVFNQILKNGRQAGTQWNLFKADTIGAKISIRPVEMSAL